MPPIHQGAISLRLSLMKSATELPRPIPFIQKLCAHLSEEELTEAEERLVAYLKIMIRIFERIECERSETETT